MSIEKRIYNNSKTPCERIRQKVYNINITNLCNEYMITIYICLYLLRYLRLICWTRWSTDDYSVKSGSSHCCMFFGKKRMPTILKSLELPQIPIFLHETFYKWIIRFVAVFQWNFFEKKIFFYFFRHPDIYIFPKKPIFYMFIS